MSLRHAARRLALPGPATPSCPSCSTPLIHLSQGTGPMIQRRGAGWIPNMFKGWGKSKDKDKNTRETASIGRDLNDPQERRDFMEQYYKKDLEGNIFADELRGADKPAGPDAEGSGAQAAPPQNKLFVTDPNPRARALWQRRKVIQMVRRNGALTREERVKMTERELLHKSEFLPTSLKKLVMLSRQIAGKTVDDAITQMRWSKKKMAAEVRYYLEEARDLAVAQRGMGLGRVNGELLDRPQKIQTKDGKWLEITDPTRIYIAQSWIGRGPWRGKSLDYKARGQRGIIQHPATSFTVVLKEEKTRMREYQERQAKKSAKGPWVHLPNRPISGQRPYYSW